MGEKLERNKAKGAWSRIREITSFQRKGGGVEGNTKRAKTIFNRFDSTMEKLLD